MRNIVPILSILLSACGLVGESAPKACTVPGCGGPVAPIESAPRAACGPGSNEETGLQGQVPNADRQSGRSQEGYWCNLELVGQVRHGEGATWQFAWYDDCGYYGTLPGEARQTQQGSVVVDASDPAKPVVSTILETPAMLDPHEALKVNEKRALLAAVELSGGTDTGPTGEDYFDIYDVGADCAHPQLLASVPIAGTTGHEGEWAPDGLTYYGSGGGRVNAIDVTDPAAPTLVVSLDNPSHGLNISEDGNRGYWAAIVPNGDTQPGLTIYNTSRIQAREPNAEVTRLGSVSWSDGAIAQHTIPVTIQGNPYIIFVDEGGFGTARIIDISNEALPRIVSKMKLEIHLPQNAQRAAADGAFGLIQYDGHYCAVDRRIEPTIAACGYAWSGIRVFDIRDPLSPKEIAYYIPPALNEQLAGSSNSNGGARLVDRCPAQVRVVPERGELWTQCQDNEFLILRFTNGVWPFPNEE